MKTEHTKGPWTFTTDDFVHILAGPNGEHLAEIEKEFANEFDPKHEGEFTPATGLANARLMATSPELLEALRGITGALAMASEGMRISDWHSVQCLIHAMAAKAEAAIANAEASNG